VTAIAAHRIRETLTRPAPGQMLPGEFFLRDGTPAMIWPLLPTDAGTLREGFRRLSPDSRHRRFLATLSELDDPMIRLLVDSADGVHHIALLLIVLPPEGEQGPVGVAHLVQGTADPATADIAVTVLDDWQGRGAGSALVSALMQRRPAVVTRLRTLVAADNRASLALLARAGRMSPGLPEHGVLDVTVELPPAPQTRSAAGQAADLWMRGTRTLLDQAHLFSWLPQAGVIPAAERYLDFTRRLIQLNHDLTVNWVEAASALHGAVWEQAPAESAGDVAHEPAALAAR
jgi:GNAT superfamily N-acetyltransferase